MNTILERIYFDPGHPGSLGGVAKLYKWAKQEDDRITIDDVRQWLSGQNVYTLHRPARRTFLRNRIYVSYIDEQWEIDLIDMRHMSRQNDGFKYILVVIDSFSKFVFAKPTKTKTSLEILNVLKSILSVRKPTKIRSDKGGEFDNKLFRAYCAKRGIIYFTTTNSGIKCAIVERVNRTLKERLFRYFTSKGTRKYIDVLDEIVGAYNQNHHRSIGMAPIDVNESNESVVFQNLYGRKNLIGEQIRDRPRLRVGDTVRQKYDLSAFDKSYYPLWTDMVYTVDKYYPKLRRPHYTVNLEGDHLNRRFYPEELQKVTVDPNTKYSIERIIRKRTVNGQHQSLVKWKGYPAKYNQWIPTDQME